MLAGVYARDIFRPDDEIRVDDIQGTVEEVSAIYTTLRTDEGNLVHIPNHMIVNAVVITTAQADRPTHDPPNESG
jgi:small-conductance mechanosensitive channel